MIIYLGIAEFWIDIHSVLLNIHNISYYNVILIVDRHIHGLRGLQHLWNVSDRQYDDYRY